MITDLPFHNTLRDLRLAAEQDGPPSFLEALELADRRLRKRMVVGRARKAGDLAPRFVLPDQQGRQVSSVALLERGPLVVSFYRGDWCPYCSKALQALAHADAGVRALEATLVGVESALAAETPPQRPDPEPQFPRLVDAGANVARKFGVAIEIAPELRPVYAASGFRPAAGDEEAGWFMALPATFVVAPSGQIVLSYLDTDFRSRLEPQELLTALSHLRARQVAAGDDLL